MSNNDFDFKKSDTKQEVANTDSATSEQGASENKVEKPKYSKEELIQIFDEMIFQGSYSEKVELRGGKLKVVFRTRTAEESENISKVIDTTTANLVATIVEKRQLINLHYAIESYQGTDLSGLKVEEKAKFINKLPGPVVGALMIALGKFDEKVFEATKEGEENF
jgi:hypothetical protein